MQVDEERAMSRNSSVCARGMNKMWRGCDGSTAVHPSLPAPACVAEDLLGGVGLENLGALVPLVHVVRVLPQHHAAQQLWSALHQMLKPR